MWRQEMIQSNMKTKVQTWRNHSKNKMIEKNWQKWWLVYRMLQSYSEMQEQDSQSKRRLSKKLLMLCQNDFTTIVAEPTSRQGSVLTNRETGMKTQ